MSSPSANRVETPATPAVSCVGLRKAYGEGEARVEALRGVDLQVADGELLILAGPSGCGKTTLLSIITGILDQDAGDCRVLGADLRALDEPARAAFRLRNLGLVFQAFNLLPALVARDNVAVPLLLDGVAWLDAGVRAQAALATVGLGERADARPSTLSGGQQQRVALARALVHAPRLLACDEPTSNLDQRSGMEVMQLLRNVARPGRSVLVVTHDERLYRFADRIAHMDDGRIAGIEAGPCAGQAA